MAVVGEMLGYELHELPELPAEIASWEQLVHRMITREQWRRTRATGEWEAPVYAPPNTA